MKSATAGTGAFENAVDVTHVPLSSNQATASARRPASVTAERAFSENAITRAAGVNCARISSANAGTRIRIVLSPGPAVTALPYEIRDTDRSWVHWTCAWASRSHQSFRIMPWTAGTDPVLTLACPAQVKVSAYGYSA